MIHSARRVWGMVYRHICLYRRSWPRLVEIAYWPTLELLIWGFTTQFLTRHAGSPALMAAGSLIAGVLLWEVVLRAQIGVTFTFLEEIWSRNLGHVFVSPLRPAELVAALLSVSALRTVVGVMPASVIAYTMYGFNAASLGPVLILFLLNLLIMGWWVALGIVSLLFRYGAGAEALAWTIAFGITPIACVFYPVSVLPFWLQPVAQALPAAHIFTGMRAIMAGQGIMWGELAAAAGLNAVWLAAGIALFARQFHLARVRGALISIGE